MKIKSECLYCNTQYEVDHWRKDKTRFCSRKCSDQSKKASNNTTCTFCEKEFHMKQSQLNKYSRNRGIYCGRTCYYEDMKTKTKGSLNHQFGLKGHLNSSFKGSEVIRKNHNLWDIKVYTPDHPYCDEYGRVLKYRLVVEENYKLFDPTLFIFINNKFFLKKELVVHHKDNNHDNNDVSNLEVLTKSQHTSLHNKQNTILRNELGQIKGIIKNK